MQSHPTLAMCTYSHLLTHQSVYQLRTESYPLPHIRPLPLYGFGKCQRQLFGRGFRPAQYREKHAYFGVWREEGGRVCHPPPMRVTVAHRTCGLILAMDPWTPRRYLPARPVNVSRELVGDRVFCGSYFARLNFRCGVISPPSDGSGKGVKVKWNSSSVGNAILAVPPPPSH
jgi:hypothetical protein